MRKPLGRSRWAAVLAAPAALAVLAAFAAELASEIIKLTTHYPVPSGMYHRLLTTGIGYDAGGNPVPLNTLLNTAAGYVGVGFTQPGERMRGMRGLPLPIMEVVHSLLITAPDATERLSLILGSRGRDFDSIWHLTTSGTGPQDLGQDAIGFMKPESGYKLVMRSRRNGASRSLGVGIGGDKSPDARLEIAAAPAPAADPLLMISSAHDAPGDIMHVASDGRVGIGGAPRPAYWLSVYGDAAKPPPAAWDNASDARLKDVLGPYRRSLGAVEALDVHRFELKAAPGRERVGFAAQDLLKAIPEAVIDSEAELRVSHGPIRWALLNAIRENDARIRELKRRIDALKEEGHAAR